MKWMEIITLRSVADAERKMVSELVSQVRGTDKQTQPLEVRIYRHATVDTDLSIHIYWECASKAQQQGTIGALLANAARDFGMVSHSVWIEEETNS
jgi:hypothetical protein